MSWSEFCPVLRNRDELSHGYLTGIALVARVLIWHVTTSPSNLRVTDIRTQMKPGVFREEYIAIICRELLRGLEYLHTEGKLHRDIKGM